MEVAESRAASGDDPLEDAAGGGGEPGQGGDLADDDEHDEARRRTRDDRLAEELRDPAEAQQADGDEHDACRDGEHRGELHGELGRRRRRRARTIEPESTETVEIGPTNSRREVPNSA